MTAAPVPPDPTRRWYGLGLRHLRMAARLLRAGFADGAVFHVYHGYECILSGFIAAHNFPVPPDGWATLVTLDGVTRRVYPSPGGGIQDRSAHKARLLFFGELADMTQPYFATYSRFLRFVTDNDRTNALYYDAARDRLPQQAFGTSYASGLLRAMRRFAREVRN